MGLEVPVINLIIAIPTFYSLRWGMKHFIQDEKTRDGASIIGTIIFTPILYVVGVLGFFYILTYEPQYDFDREKWFSDKQARHEMRDDLVESGILKGKSKAEVIKLIGKPEMYDSAGFWTYDLGTSGAGLGWQFNSIKLTFKSGKVARVEKIEILD